MRESHAKCVRLGRSALFRRTCSCVRVDVLLLHYLAITRSRAMHCACVITQSMPSIGNKFVITPLLVQCPIYKHHALGPTALGLGACKSDIALAGCNNIYLIHIMYSTPLRGWFTCITLFPCAVCLYLLTEMALEVSNSSQDLEGMW